VGRKLRRVESRDATRLDIVERLDGHGTPQGCKTQMAVLACVDCQDKGREIDKNADTLSPDETTPWLEAVSA
jgi:hypothetical protein